MLSCVSTLPQRQRYVLSRLLPIVVLKVRLDRRLYIYEATIFGNKICTPQTDHRFPLDDLVLSGKIHLFPDLYNLAHVAGWEPYNLHDLGHVSKGLICTLQILHSVS